MNRRYLISLVTALALASGGAMAATAPATTAAGAKSMAVKSVPAQVAAGKSMRCRDAKGHFEKCAPKPAASKTCRDAKGKFASCKR